MPCSLCGKEKPAKPLNSDDPVFRIYILLSKRLGLSKHDGHVGVCKGCMERYLKMREAYRKKTVTYFVLSVIMLVLYLHFTGNVVVAMVIFCFVMLLSLLSYVPPLKD